ncbi:rhamnose ABC transporter substrate-binding protein [Sinisalibacter aestuarii]|uniref:Rhamnose ABC transporter substrate-binding protein n=1 Tax=Sinisalibacter aestuarii TaxID=2949426 RepID=A0ABQ5LY38_9RHOB|nr:rhamnose ABC transporter substrate-binding protein [Sinisalibacter aestuarii]GKY89859.1 rhamnose ABC transporter substrate-binding protein [Sinisalibacter aestuarii]
MSVMQKVLTTAAMATSLAATTTAANAQDMRIALVVKALGIGFFEAAAKGAEEAAGELGGTEIIYTGPTDTTAEGQIEVINSLIAQGVDAIAISANDPDALVPALKKAMDRGITVISWDSGVAPEGRMMHLNPSSTELIGNTILKLAADHMPDGGDVAILSASATATNQNAWIEAAKAVLPNYPGINLVATVYGDDLSDKSYREAQGLMATYPDLKAIIAPTTVGILASCQAVTDEGKIGQVNVTGLGLPSEMAGCVESGATESFAIWNPIDLGYAATYIAHELAAGNAAAEPGASISMGRIGAVTLDDTNTGAMSDPFTYDASNIEEFKSIF